MKKYSKKQHLINKTKRLKIIAFFIRLFNHRYSHCHYCGLTWNVCKSKSIMLNRYNGVFATCKYCWDTLPLNKLEKCYTELYFEQKKSVTRHGYKLDYNLSELLDALREQYIESRGKLGIRKEKIDKLLCNLK